MLLPGALRRFGCASSSSSSSCSPPPRRATPPPSFSSSFPLRSCLVEYCHSAILTLSMLLLPYGHSVWYGAMRLRYGLCGTEVAYAATRSLRHVRYCDSVCGPLHVFAKACAVLRPRMRMRYSDIVCGYEDPTARAVLRSRMRVPGPRVRSGARR
eukprot:1699229-Rhodomonas_salina.2